LWIPNVGADHAMNRAGWSSLVRGTRGGPAVLVEVIIVLLAALVFTFFHAAAGKSATAASANARTLQSVDRALHIDIERTANAWLAEHPALIQPAVYYYRLYYAVLFGVLLWVFISHAEVYLRVRRTLVAMSLLVLPVFWAVPMSPPRFALPGIVDIVAEHDFWGSHASTDLDNGQNHFSVMPSMHVGWSLWCAYAVWSHSLNLIGEPPSAPAFLPRTRRSAPTPSSTTATCPRRRPSRHAQLALTGITPGARRFAVGPPRSGQPERPAAAA